MSQNDIYSNPELYDAIHNGLNLDAKLIKKAASKINGSVLELASGTGRLTKCILELGLNYTGIDNSKTFIKAAINKYADRAKFIFGDMRDFRLDKKFDFIFIGFNSFLHNLTTQDAKKCLNCINQHLNENGQFLISIYIPDNSFLYRNEKELSPVTPLFEYDGSKCRILEENKYDQESQVNSLTWYLEKDGEIMLNKYCYKMRMYYPHEMDLLLTKTGFNIQKKVGDYKGNRMDYNSDMQIYLCDKI